MAVDLGKEITADDILDQTAFFDNWEDKYAFIIDLGKQLPEFPDSDRNTDNGIDGCQSAVWIKHEKQHKKFIFHADSDAIIVKGLLAIILSAYNHKTADEIAAFDIENYFNKLDLLNHISNVRGNGIKAMIARIQQIAKNH